MTRLFVRTELRCLATILMTGVLLVAARAANAQTLSPVTFRRGIVFEDGFSQLKWIFSSVYSAPFAAAVVVRVEGNVPGAPFQGNCATAPNLSGFTATKTLPLNSVGTFTVRFTVIACNTGGELATSSGWATIQSDGTFTSGSGDPPPATLTVLPTTTRWRPQRDVASPIDVVFRGPADLDLSTIRVEVTPPATFGGTYTPALGQASRVPDTADEYTVHWLGPWAVPDSSNSVKPIPRGDYGVRVRGRRVGQTDELASQIYDDVSLVEVVSVELQPLDGAVIEPNPGPGADATPLGDRIFAEATEPTSSINPTPAVFDRVRVVARLEPVVVVAAGQQPVDVHFRVVDVDDPSASGKPVDDEGLSTDNRGDRTAGLFRDASTARQPSSTPDALVGAPLSSRVESGLAETEAILRVSRRQGDNYRVLASTSLPWVGAPKAY